MGCGIVSTSNLQNPTLVTSPNCITVATLTITTANGCINTYTDTIYYGYNPCNTPVSPMIVSSPANNCIGSITLASSQTNLSFQWNNGTTGNALYNLCPGNYAVTVTNPTQNCFNVYQYTVPLIPVNNCNYVVTGTISPVTTPGGSDGAIAANVVNPNVINLPYSYQWNTGDTTATVTGLSEGLYSVTVFSPSCTQGVQHYFYVYELNTGVDSTLIGYLQNLMDTCLNFTPTQYAITGYQLLNNNTILVSWLFTSSTGATQTITTQYSYTFTNGAYYLVLIINCSNAKSLLGFGSYIKIENIVGVDSYNQHFKIYPNPAQDQFTIEANQTPYQFTLFDISGREIYNTQVSDHQFVISASHLAPGTYFIQYKTEQGIKNDKLMIIK
jgi:hypothetical protein